MRLVIIIISYLKKYSYVLIMKGKAKISHLITTNFIMKLRHFRSIFQLGTKKLSVFSRYNNNCLFISNRKMTQL